MDEHFSDDCGRDIDWSRTSEDYVRHRPGYPPSFFARLAALGVGLPGQRILDLGTGTGALALPFAEQGSRVTGVDVAAGQVAAAARLAREAGQEVDFLVADGQQTGLPDASFDRITASQCFGYFEPSRIWPELRRLLAPGGRVLTCHLCWLPREDPIARASEQLVRRHVPSWSGGDYSGQVAERPASLPEDWEVESLLLFDEELPFTRESWRGRFRACRATGASMRPAELAAFDAEHAELLASMAPEAFAVRHRIDAHLIRPT